MENRRGRNPFEKLLAWFSGLYRFEPGEGRLLLYSATYFFLLLLSYYLLRPIREAAGIEGEQRVLRWLFLATFCVMILATPLYGVLVARLSRVRFIALSTIAFSVQIALFVAAFQIWPEDRLIVGRVFFVWLSVFNLFVVSIFWSLMVERWPHAAGKRLFGMVAAGGSLGGIVGSQINSLTADSVSVEWILLLSSGVLLLTLLPLRQIVRLRPLATDANDALPERQGDDALAENRPIGGGNFEGLLAVARSRYLLQAASYLFVLTICGTFVYFLQAELVASFSLDAARRREIFADINTGALVLTFIFQFFGFAALIRGVGVGKTLGILPVIYLLGFLGFAALPVLGSVAVFQVLRRSVGYGVTSPSREVLFTVLPREQKYKAKAFIDTVVYRGGDVVGAQLCAELLERKVSVGTIAWGVAPLCVVWFLLATALGREVRRRSQLEEEVPLTTPARATPRGPSPPSPE